MASSGEACGDLLRRYRLLAGLTQDELADRSGYTANYVGELERGTRRPPEAAVRRIANVLGLSDRELSDLLHSRERRGSDRSGLPRIVGRTGELADVRRLLAGTNPTALLFRGEPGVGKTRLLDEAAALAGRCGWRVVRGGCRPRASDPYAPLTEAVANSMRDLPEQERAAAVRVAERLDLLLPELAGFGEMPVGDALSSSSGVPAAASEHGRRLLFAAVRDYLLAVGGDAGTLLVVDDVQWAGQDALELLTVIADEEAAHGRLRMIGAYRDIEAPSGSPAGEFAAALAQLPWARVVGLGLLSDAESQELLLGLLPPEGHASGSTLSAIVRRAGGMPLFLVSFAEELERHGDSGAGLEVPWSVAQVVRQRLAALPPQVQELLSIASIAADAAEPGLLCEATSQTMEGVLAALTAACDAHLLIDDGDGCRFAHDLVRETIEQDLSVGWRRLWHARLGAALMHLPERRRQGRAAQIAWHLEEADDPEQALPWIVRAGDEAAARAGHAAAEDRYGTAAELARALGNERTEADAAFRLGDTCFRLARYADALEPLERAAEGYLRVGERDLFLTTIGRIGEMYSLCWRPAEGIERVLPVVRELEAEEPGLRSRGAADLYAALSALHLNVIHLQDAIATAETAVSLSAATGNLRAGCTAELMRALALGALERRSEQRLSYERVAASAERLGDQWLLAGVLGSQGDAHVAVNDLADGELLIRRALEIAERAGLSAAAALTRSKLADLLVRRGHWDDARQQAERARSESLRLGSRPGHIYILVSLSRVLLLAGERRDGLRHLRDALELATELNYPPGIVDTNELLAWQEVRDGEPDAAIARLKPIVHRRQQAGRPWYPIVYAWAHVDAGNEQDAEAVLAGARAQAAADSRPEPPERLLQSAKLAAIQGRNGDAARDIQTGLATARAVGLPYEHALLLEEDARLHAADGEPDRARELLVQAVGIFKRLGAAPDATRTQHALEECGHGREVPGAHVTLR